MSAFPVLPAQAIIVARVAVQMSDAGLPAPFVSAVLKMALQEEGFFDLVELWRDAEDRAEREEVEADLAELLEDVEQGEALPAGPQRPPTKDELRAFGPGASDQVVAQIAEHKKRLRELIDAHGGVSEVARLAGMPQPSLSRLLNGGAMPRRTTLHRIATAMGVKPNAVMGEWSR